MDFLWKNRRMLLIGLAGLTVFFLVGASRLRVNFSFDRFYPHDTPEYQYFEAYEALFGQDQNLTYYVALGPEKGEVFQPEFLQKADEVFLAISQIPGVDTATFATRVPFLQRRGMGVSRKPLFQWENDSALLQTRERLQTDPLISEIFLTKDQRFVCGFFQIKPEIFETSQRDEVSKEIKETVEKAGLTYVVSGLPYIRSAYVWKIARELAIFTGISFLLILLVLFLIYRSIWGVAVPVITVLIGMIWVAGTMGWLGQQIDLLNNMLIPIIFVVGMSDILHLITKYLQERKAGIDSYTAVRTTIREIGSATFLTSFTTAIGFASLAVSRVPPIRALGLTAAVGVMFAWGITMLVVPIWLSRGREKDQLSRYKGNGVVMRRILDRLEIWVSKHPVQVLITFGVLSLASIFGAYQIPRETYLLEDVGKNDPIRQSMEFFEQNAFGMRPFEAGVNTRKGALVTDLEVLKLLEGLEVSLDSSAHFAPFFSPASVIREANYLYHFRRPQYRTLPETQEEVDELVSFLELGGGSAALRKVMDANYTHARLSSRIPDIGADKFGQLTDQINRYLELNDPQHLLQIKLTGNAVLTENNLRYIRSSLLIGLNLAFVIIAMLMAYMFRSFRMVLISLIPNIIPLVFTAGIMGLFGIPLTASSSIVFVVAFGIAVDDTIHVLTRFRAEISKGKSKEIAIRITMQQTGEAMVLTSVVLMAGFSLLCISDFGATKNVGLLTSLTIAFALIADLVLLPVLLRFLLPEKPQPAVLPILDHTPLPNTEK